MATRGALFFKALGVQKDAVDTQWHLIFAQVTHLGGAVAMVFS